MPSSLAVLAVALGVGLLFLFGFAKSNVAAKDLLIEYRKLLCDAREEKAVELERQRKVASEIDEAAPLDPTS